MAVPTLYSGYVLTGGMSTRMGQDKALMEVSGRPLVLHVAETVERAAGKSVTLVGSRERYAFLGFPVVEDLEPGLGPLSGIHAALRNTTSVVTLVVGCDMPFLNPAFLEYLLTIAIVADAQAVVPESSEWGFEGLCAVYAKEALPAVEAALQAGDRKLSHLYERLPVRVVSADECRPYNFHGLLFHNVNTPEDFEYARSRLETIARGNAQGA